MYSFLLTDLMNTEQAKDLSYVLCLYAGMYVSLYGVQRVHISINKAF